MAWGPWQASVWEALRTRQAAYHVPYVSSCDPQAQAESETHTGSIHLEVAGSPSKQHTLQNPLSLLTYKLCFNWKYGGVNPATIRNVMEL